ncbi:hypothetical protein LOD99_137 [Oopsacas minuta]|uniref:Uncharacterized protein n=1 Tax=Oopsacas minuta TaxID=111878 RepID=A0AAV7K871_9METZ|nr:hypothetical protein LOD99_137 [Oopsacas minuta]
MKDRANKKQRNNPNRSRRVTEVEEHYANWKPLSIAVGIGVLYYCYISGLFENDLFFSHLSTLERELAFRTEMGLYYSYYKTVAEAPSLSEGINELLNDNSTEYPSTINTLQRFNLYPEVILGVIFRVIRHSLPRTCYKINRGYNQPVVESCVGVGDIHNFYVTCIFALNGLLGGLLFYVGWSLSGSMWGGSLSIIQFMYNHGESTRIMWTPPLRESFSFPFLFVQILVLVNSLKSTSFTWKHFTAVTLSTTCFMIPWQFAQFALFTQLLSLLAIYLLGYLSHYRYQAIIICQITALAINYVLQFFNSMLFSSLLFPCLLVCLAVTAIHSYLRIITNNLLRWTIQVSIVGTGTLLLKFVVSRLSGIQDDNHIFNILRSKFTDYKDFDTQLYTCAAEFDFIGWVYVGKVCLTLLLPACVFVLFDLTREYLNTFKLNSCVDNRSADQAPRYYIALQTIAFSVLAILIMRLKLFFTPTMCLLVSLLPACPFANTLTRKNRDRLLMVFLLISSLTGGYNIYRQLRVYGEYNNPNMEELILWIRDNTLERAVFAGSMSTMANIKLSTGRPIANHPHYENKDIRERTRLVYHIFARVSPTHVYNTMKGIGIDYIVVEDGFCNKETREGCKLADALALENENFQEEVAFCELVTFSTPPGFKQVFNNQNHRVLQVM